MVILRGIVRDGKKSTQIVDAYISGAVLSQGVGWGTVTTDGSGAFYTSANVYLDLLAVDAENYKNSTISVAKFATHYDGRVVISGSLTQTVYIDGLNRVYLMDSTQNFVPGVLSGRVVTIMEGIDDGKTAVINGNTDKSISLGGTSRVVTAGWTF
jgi:hypothetical protein